MNKGTKLRQQVHYILLDVYKYSYNIDEAYLKNNLNSLNTKDRAFINNVCMNSMRYLFHTKKILFLYTNKNPKLHERILLYSAITQIVFLNFKDYAVIDSTVEVAKKLKKFHGFINAVLKKICVDKKKLNSVSPDFKDLPLWFLKQTKDLKKYEKKDFIKNFFLEPDLHLVFKNKKCLLDFKENNYPTSTKSCFLLERKKVWEIKSFSSGNWWVQDFSSSLPLNNINENEIQPQCIDLCAAPGGKSFQLLSKNIEVVLNDKSEKRIKLLKTNLKRLKYNPNILNFDARCLNNAKKYKFIVLDAPCSSVGTIRKNPEIFFKMRGPDLKSLVKLQTEILNKASKILDKNGIILYMVCSFLKVETFEQISVFLEKNKNFKVTKFFVDERNKYTKNFIKDNKMITLPTQLNGYNIDGYFAAYLRKIK